MLNSREWKSYSTGRYGQKFHAVHQTGMEMLLERTGKYALYQSFRPVSVILDSIFVSNQKETKNSYYFKILFWNFVVSVVLDSIFRFKPKKKKIANCFEILFEFYLASVTSHLVPPSSLRIGIELALWHCAQQAHSPLRPSLILFFLLGLASH